jgi:uncharacterized membrane protein YeaQ/YmgE (transglycosylase-associated protein family)
MNFKACGGRRFLLSVGCGLVTTALCWAGKIDGGTFAMVMLGTVGAFIGGNVYESVKAPK